MKKSIKNLKSFPLNKQKPAMPITSLLFPLWLARYALANLIGEVMYARTGKQADQDQILDWPDTGNSKSLINHVKH